MRVAPLRVAWASSVLLAIPVLAVAATQSVTEEASYAMGDNDTRAQAREICVAKVERKALEASGSLVESEMDMISTEKGQGGGVKDSAQQHVRSYVGAVVTASGVKDVFHLEGDRIVVDCTATVTFNPDEVRDRLRAARADNTTKAEVDQQQQRIAALEAQVQSLTLKLAMNQQAQALTQAQQQQILSQAQQAQALAQAQTRAYAQAQALAQIERQGQGAPPPRPSGGGVPPAYSLSPAAPAAPGTPHLPQDAAGDEPPPPAAQPRFRVDVAPLPGPSARATSPGAAPQAAAPAPAVPAPQLAAAGGNPRARAIRAGMSAAVLIKMIGTPRASIHEYFQVYSWDYGNIWVTINAGIVQCVSVRQNPMCRYVLAYR